MRGQTLRLNKNLMAVFIGKTMNLILNRRAITRTDALNFAAEHRAAIEILADDLMCALIGVGDVAADLTRMHADITHVAHHWQRRIAWLLNHHAKIHRTGIDARRCACLQATNRQLKFAQTISQSNRWHVTSAAATLAV